MTRTMNKLLLSLLLCFAFTQGGAAQSYLYNIEGDSTKQDTALTEADLPVLDPAELAAGKALAWVRRLLFRSFPDYSTTGLWAQYAESDWNRTAGSYGPVRAHMTVNYLGTTAWLGKGAEHFQFIYRTLELPKVTVEVDVIVSPEDKVGEIHRAVYRVNKGEIRSANMTLEQGQLDYDKLDRPKPGEPEELRMYSGTYHPTVYAGTGANAAKVYAYRVAELPPLDLVILGYGNEALVYKKGGDSAVPSFDAPAPSVR